MAETELTKEIKKALREIHICMKLPCRYRTSVKMEIVV